MRIGRETLRNVSGTDTQRVKGKKKGVGIDDNLGSQSSIIGILRTEHEDRTKHQRSAPWQAFLIVSVAC
jgi:hypothetical protein